MELEFKILIVFSILGLLKLLGFDSEDPDHVWLARCIFIAGHFSMGAVYKRLRTIVSNLPESINSNIDKNENVMEKNIDEMTGKELKKIVTKSFILVGIRFIIISIIHFKTGIALPLILSNIIGLFLLMEDKIFQKFIWRKNKTSSNKKKL